MISGQLYAFKHKNDLETNLFSYKYLYEGKMRWAKMITNGDFVTSPWIVQEIGYDFELNNKDKCFYFEWWLRSRQVSLLHHIRIEDEYCEDSTAEYYKSQLFWLKSNLSELDFITEVIGLRKMPKCDSKWYLDDLDNAIRLKDKYIFAA